MSEPYKHQELQLFIQAMKQRFGYDFSQYQPDSLLRRVETLAKKQQCQHISELIPLIYHQQNFLQQAITQISVGHTEFFRDPEVYKALTAHVLAKLTSYPSIKVWSAGCSTGEEAYSLAILFEDAGLLDKTTIYATDINSVSIEQAKKGLIHPRSVKQDCINYHQAGGLSSFSDYFSESNQQFHLDDKLKHKVSFNTHNLESDAVFCETQLVVCRNVLIYFEPELQAKVFKLFIDSLARHCFLLLGQKDCLYSKVLLDSFVEVDKQARLYRKK